MGDRYLLFCGVVDDLVLESIIPGATGWVSGPGQCLFFARTGFLWDLAAVQAGSREASRGFLLAGTPRCATSTPIPKGWSSTSSSPTL